MAVTAVLTYILAWGFISFFVLVFTEQLDKVLVGLAVGVVVSLPLVSLMGILAGHILLIASHKPIFALIGIIASSLIGTVCTVTIALPTIGFVESQLKLPIESWLIVYILCSILVSTAISVLLAIATRLIRCD